MSSNAVMVGVSPKQISRLRNGHKVRVKPPMEGEGICLIVDPQNYSQISRTFSRNKGTEIQLTPSEIAQNKEVAPEMEGQGIFGKKFDKALKKAGIKDLAYAIGDQAKPYVKAGLTAGLASGATALGTVQPELIPFLPGAVAGASYLASDYMDRPGYYQGRKSTTMAKEYAKNQALNKLNEQLGTNMGNISSNSIQQALANKAQAELANYMASQQTSIDPNVVTSAGAGLYAGGGLYAGARRNGGAVGLNAGMVRQLPPALQSQPFGANYHFKTHLPPAYQKLKN